MSQAETNSAKKTGVSWYEIAFLVIMVALIGVTILSRNRRKVGIVRMDEVARACGIEAQVAGEVRQWEDEARQRVEAIRQEYGAKSKELETARDAAQTDAAREAAAKEIDGARADMQQRVTAVHREIQQQRATRAAELRGQFAPILMEVTRKHKLDILLSHSANVLSVAPGVDLTEEVILLARERLPAPSPAAFPEIPAGIGPAAPVPETAVPAPESAGGNP